MNILKPDCGFDPTKAFDFHLEARNEPKEVTAAALKAAGGFDLTGKTVMFVALDDEAAGVTIASLENMEEGKKYTLIATNAAAKKLEVTFPTGTKYQGTITAANGMTVVYEFFTADDVIYCRKAIFAAA